MKKIFAFLFLFSFLLNSYSSVAQTINGSFMHNGINRSYELYIPINYNSNNAVPLVMNFHGFGGSGLQQRTSTNFKPIADSANFIIVHPTGTLLAPFGLNHWNVGSWTVSSTTDDLGFAAALIDTISAQYNINLMRVYACGFSNGGFFSHKLASQLGYRFAAIASVSGTFSPEMKSNFNPSHSMPVMHIHGTADATVPYNGTTANGGMESVDTVIQYWVNYNNCSTTPTITALPDINTADSSTVEHFVYAHSSNGINVELLKVTNGAHQWPGASGNMDIIASLEIWKFFSRYSNTAVGINNIANNKTSFILYPNPCSNSINVQGAFSKHNTYELYTIIGNKIQSGKLSMSQHTIELTELPNGVYYLKLNNAFYQFSKLD